MVEWQPVATVASALLVLAAALLTVRQRDRADRKDQWWKRTQWALDLVLTGDEHARVLGMSVLQQQVESTLADEEDLELLAAPALWSIDLPPVARVVPRPAVDKRPARGDTARDDEER